ncbi:probable N-acetyltransferase 16 [Hyperolius riggenbachi]|uniref:probable N-acetyltransferase 16 n=1 Tax=Hyperolius riggenbachi TaxID=752182 RepID=UPI0035A35BFF
MSEPSMAPVEFVPSTAEDYEELMSISEGIYNGIDYLPFRYHAWLKDPKRHMFLGKSEGRIVGFGSFLLVDEDETAVVEGLRVSPWLRGQGVAGMIQKFCIEKLRVDHPKVKRILLTHVNRPSPAMLKKYRLIHSKAVVTMILPFDQIEGTIKLLESRLGNVGQSNNYTILEPSEVLRLFEGTKTTEELLPGGLLVQHWLPLTAQRSNLEMLLKKGIVWMHQPENNADKEETNSSHPLSLSSPTTSQRGFLSLGTPLFPIPYGEATYCLDIDMFGVDPACAKIHVVQQLKLSIQDLPVGSNIICLVYAEESLRTELNHLFEGQTPFILATDEVILEMDIRGA